MESGVDFSNGVKIWGDFSWISAIDAAASISLMISMFAIAGLNLSLIFLPFRALWLLDKRENGKALRAMLFAPVGLAVFYAAIAVGPYALLGLWSGLAIAGAAYAVARRITLWRLLRKYPDAIRTSDFSNSFPKVFFQSGSSVRWMYRELEAPTSEILEKMELEAHRAPGAVSVVKPKASVRKQSPTILA